MSAVPEDPPGAPGHAPAPSGGTDRARAAAARACEQAGVRVVVLEDPEGCDRAEQVLRTVWGAGPTDSSLMTSALLVALSHAGGYVAGIVPQGEPTRMIGVCAGFFGPPGSATLHSHVAGLVPGTTSHGAGRAVKLHQRAWALERGATSITWTYDPLVSRNAHFNLERLGGVLEEYLPNQYGILTDGINAGEPSDRGLIRWWLTDPVVTGLADRPRGGGGVPAGGVEAGSDGPGTDAPQLLAVDEGGAPVGLDAPPGAERGAWVAVPDDIEGLRRTDPALALEWRWALREELGARLARGWSVRCFRRGRGYLIGVDGE